MHRTSRCPSRVTERRRRAESRVPDAHADRSRGASGRIRGQAVVPAATRRRKDVDGPLWSRRDGGVRQAQMAPRRMNTAGVSAHDLLHCPATATTRTTAETTANCRSSISSPSSWARAPTSTRSFRGIQLTVWGFDPGMGFPPPLHVLCHDAEGSLAFRVPTRRPSGRREPDLRRHERALHSIGI